MIKPTGKHLLVSRIFRPYLGSIAIPETLQDDCNIGGPKECRVIAAGPKVEKDIEPGDRVICHSWTEGPIEAGDRHYIITEQQVLAVIKKGEPEPHDHP